MSPSLLDILKNKIRPFFTKDNIDIELYAEIPLLIIGGPTIGLDIRKKSGLDNLTPEEAEGLRLLARNVGKTIEDLTDSINNVLKIYSREDILKLYNILEKLEHDSDDLHKDFTNIRNLLNPTILLSPSEFELRTENRSIHSSSFVKFVGRNSEVCDLRHFLEDDQKVICLMTGRGGSGKTRLALEFSKIIFSQFNEWDVFFIDRFKKFVTLDINKNTLLILDETSRYLYRPSLLSFVANFRIKGLSLKLLLIDRPIFKQNITAELKEFDIKPVELQIAKAEIKTALIQNFEVSEKYADLIEKNCVDNFIFAEIIVTFFKETGSINLQNAVDYRISKYVNDLNQKFGNKYDVTNINKILQFLALIHELDPESDIELLKNFEKANKRTYTILKDLLLDSDKDEYYESDLIIFSELGKYSIIFDPLADYFVYQYLKENNQRWDVLKNKILELIKYKPAFVIRNFLDLVSVEENWFSIDDNDVILIREVLTTIWDDLNSTPGGIPEYFEAIRDLSAYNLAVDSSLNSKTNYLIWEESYNQIVIAYPSLFIDTTANYAKCLFNAAYLKQDENEILGIQKKIKVLTENSKSDIIKEIYAKFLVNCIVWLQDSNIKTELEKVSSSELLKIYIENPQSEAITIEYTKFLANRLRFNRGVIHPKDLIAEIEEISVIYDKIKNSQISIIYSNYLHSASYILVSSKNTEQLLLIHEKIKTVFIESEEFELIGIEYAKSLFNLLFHFAIFKQSDKIRPIIEELSIFYEIHPNYEDLPRVFSIGFKMLFRYFEKGKNLEGYCYAIGFFRNLVKEKSHSDRMKEMYLKSLFSSLIFFAKISRRKYQKRTTEEIKKIYTTLSLSEYLVQLYALLSLGIFDYYFRNGFSWHDQDEILVILKKAAADNPKSEMISYCYADCLFKLYFSKKKNAFPEKYVSELFRMRNLIPQEKQNRENMIQEIEQYARVKLGTY